MLEYPRLARSSWSFTKGMRKGPNRMSRKRAILWGAVAALALAGGPAARADYFYNFSPITNPTVFSDHSGMSITLGNQAQVGPIATNQNTNVVATTLSTFINPGITGTDTFNT